MDLAEERVRWLIRFAELDLDQLRPGDWLNLQDELQDFFGTKLGVPMASLGLGAIIVMPTQEPLPHQYPERAFRKLQADVRALLEAPDRMLELEKLHVGRTMGRLGMVTGPTRETCVVLAWLLLLGMARQDRLRHCLECQKRFYRVRRQLYCSARCTDKANMRAFRKKQKNEAKQREVRMTHGRGAIRNRRA